MDEIIFNKTDNRLAKLLQKMKKLLEIMIIGFYRITRNKHATEEIKQEIKQCE